MSGLTINQEKEIRKRRLTPALDVVHYQHLAVVVSRYRRAQKLTGPGAAEARKDLLAEIDACLEALGL